MGGAAPQDLDALIDGVVTLPSMPEVVTRLLQMLDDPNCALGEVARTISLDPSISLKTLRLVNSAYYGLGQEVTTVEHAVVLLGGKVIKNLALTATVFDTMGGCADLFLRHCVGCGVAMKSLHHCTPLAGLVESADEAFVIGLLHDIGKVILSEYLPEKMEEVAVRLETERVPWFRLERAIIGADHAALGGRLAYHWKLPERVVYGVAGHHQPTAVPEQHRKLAAYVALANHLCNAAGHVAFEHAVRELPEAVWDLTELSHADVVAASNAFFDAAPAVGELACLAV
jgi:putative nucleotidyltransferase with HDIG domain